jgi:protein-S-isoprenylcysteine O-methyltransferase Ste14
LKRYNLICGAHNGLEFLLILVTILTRDGIAGPARILQIAGFSILAFGLFLLVYSGVHLKRAARSTALAEVEALATGGPYGIVRHPYYLGDIILIMGLAIGLRSVWGIVGTLFLLIPSAIYVARMEDEALAEKFGEDWRSYAKQTYFMFPPIY